MTYPKQLIRWHPEPSTSALIADAKERVLDAAARALDARGSFVIVLAGGTTPRALYEQLRDAKTDWSLWHIWFGDGHAGWSLGDERFRHVFEQLHL